ncbi:sigma-70 family RNA polymerase sigma factor [Microbacterium trichothecenolyticum]|uniref:RNA polymerase sigma-B factor n=1 Tax=Microbacterium trichothecenolyticum TaxID=69370 RepID=A0ABU0TSF2_MICTR|nr:sigma-70 family RNA polymerase sigma factor [Microbacterium trichothecenolyticum]MDQ1122606.1 RNA polymerase sigma-B factor [Microbacterium trichothecenolyticum]
MIRSASSQELAQRLTLDNLALARSVARRFFSRATARDDDLVQVAYIGLWNAARRFDPERGASFAAFAVPTISGEIKRHLRDHGWFVRPPRTVQDLRSRIGEASPRLAQRLGRRPSVAELTADLGSRDELVREAIDSRHSLRPASLDVSVGVEGESTLADVLSDGGSELERVELSAVLWAAQRALTPRERRVVHLRFFEDRTQQDIADELGVTQMQVSRILTKSLGILRESIVHGSRPLPAAS